MNKGQRVAEVEAPGSDLDLPNGCMVASCIAFILTLFVIVTAVIASLSLLFQ